MNLYLSESSGLGGGVGVRRSGSGVSGGGSARGSGNTLNEKYSYDVDPELSWQWLHKVMDEARKKRQNVRHAVS